MSSAFHPVRSVDLEEGTAVTTVNPRVRLLANGRYLIADFSESQVRTYDSIGHLLRYYGGRGRGPKEFPLPLTSALQLKSGFVVATEFNGTIIELDSTLQEEAKRTSSFLMPLYAAYVMSDSELLLAGPPAPTVPIDANPKLLHLFNLNSQSVSSNFFPPPVTREFAAAAETMGIVSAATHGDTIAATFALTDTIFLFRHGLLIDRVPIPFRLFSHIVDPEPSGSSIASRDQWLSEISMITDLYWLRNGSYVIQYYRGAQPRGEMSLFIMRKDGTVQLEAQDTPTLLSVDEQKAKPQFLFETLGREGARKWNVQSFVAY